MTIDPFCAAERVNSQCLTPLLLAAVVAALPATAQPPPLLEPDLFDEPGELTDDEEAAPACRIVFDGNTGGVSSGRMELGFGDLLFAYLERHSGRIVSVRSGVGALYREGRYLWTDDGLLSSALTFLEAGGFEVVEQVDPAQLIRTDLAVLFQGVHDPDLALLDFVEAEMGERHGYTDAIRLQGILTRYRNVDGAEAWAAQGPGMPPDAPLVQEATAWEVRSQETVVVEVTGQTHTLHQLSRMIGEGTRRKALVEALQAQEDSPAIYVSAGGVVEGRSFLPGQDLSLHRPFSWAAHGDAGLRLLAPGVPELMGGLDLLTLEAEWAGVQLLAANLRDATGEQPFPGAELVELGGVDIAFVGVVDPAVEAQLDGAVRSGLDVEPPVAAVHRALATLRASSATEPDLVVLLAGFEPDTLGQLVRDVADVDVVIGDFGAAVPRAQVERVQPTPQRERAHALDRRPLMVVHASGVEVGELEVRNDDDGQLQELTLRTHPITQLLPADDETLTFLMEIRQQVYLDGEPVLIPNLRELVEEDINRLQFLVQGQPYQRLIEAEMATGSLAVERLQLRMTRGLFANIASNLLMRKSGADVVVLPPLPWPFDLSGATRDLYAASYLAVPDELKLVELTGSQIRELLRLIGDARNAPSSSPRRTASGAGTAAEKRTGAPWVAGLDTTHGKVGGRPISSSEVYRVLTTTALDDYEAVSTVTSGAKTRTRFRQRRGRFRTSAIGEELTLRSQVIGGLEETRAADPTFGPAYRRLLSDLLEERGEEVRPQFYARADELGVTLTQYFVAGDQDAYTNVSESRVTTPASFTFGLRAKGVMGIDTRKLVLESSAQAILTVNTIGDAEPTELEDDLLFAVDLGLKALSIRDVPVYPFLQASYDTEFIRADETDDDGEVIGQQARQKDLRGTAGVTATNLIPTVETVKTGPFLQYDFSAEEGAFEGGMMLEVSQKLTRSPLTWANTLKLYGWFPTEDDTDEDLQVSLNARTELGIAVLGNLQFKVYADLLAYRGKVEATSNPGLSTIIGVELAYSGKVKATIW